MKPYKTFPAVDIIEKTFLRVISDLSEREIAPAATLNSLKENRAMLCNSYKSLYPDLMRRLHRSDKLLDYFEACSHIEDTTLNLLEMQDAT